MSINSDFLCCKWIKNGSYSPGCRESVVPVSLLLRSDPSSVFIKVFVVTKETQNVYLKLHSGFMKEHQTAVVVFVCFFSFGRRLKRRRAVFFEEGNGCLLLWFWWSSVLTVPFVGLDLPLAM